MYKAGMGASSGLLFVFILLSAAAAIVSGPLVGLLVICLAPPVLISYVTGAFYYITHSWLSLLYILTLVVTSVAPSLGLLGTLLRFALSAVIVAFLLFRTNAQSRVLPKHLVLAIILLVCLLTAAALGSPSLFYGLSRLVNWLMFLPLFFLYRRFPLSGAVISGFIVSGILQMGAVVLQFVGVLGGTWGGLIVSGVGYDPVNSTWMKRYTGFVQDPNSLGLWLCFSALAALYLLVTDRRVAVKMMSVVLFLAFSYGIFMSGSRGSIVALAVGILVFCFLVGRKGLAVGLCLVCLASIGATLSLSEEMYRVFASFAEILSGSDTSASARANIWSDHLGSNENWVLGGGFGSYAADAVSDQDGFFVSADAARSATTDNGWLKLLLECGVIGLCSYLLIFVSCGAVAVRDRKVTSRYFSAFIAASLAAFFWRSLSVDILDLNPWNAVIFMLFAAALTPDRSAAGRGASQSSDCRPGARFRAVKA